MIHAWCVPSQSQSRLQTLPCQEGRHCRRSAQTPIEIGLVQRGIGGDDDHVSASATLEDSGLGGRSDMGESRIQKLQLGFEDAVVARIGDVGDIDTRVFEDARAGGEELRGLQGRRYRVMIEGVTDEHVKGIGTELFGLDSTVSGSQSQPGGSWQIEPGARVVQERRVDVDRGLLRTRSLGMDGPGECASGSSDVDRSQRSGRELDVDDA